MRMGEWGLEVVGGKRLEMVGRVTVGEESGWRKKGLEEKTLRGEHNWRMWGSQDGWRILDLGKKELRKARLDQWRLEEVGGRRLEGKHFGGKTVWKDEALFQNEVSWVSSDWTRQLELAGRVTVGGENGLRKKTVSGENVRRENVYASQQRQL